MRFPSCLPPFHPRAARIATALLCAAALPVCSASAAEEWSRFRGPNGSGVAKAAKVPAEISEKDLAWKTSLPGKGHSSPVIANGRAFVTCTPPDTAKRILVAVNTGDGRIAWQREWETPTFRQHADNSYTSASPAVDAERVFLWWTSPEQSWIAALDQKDGRELWKRELGAFESKHGAGSSPIVFADTVILDFGQEIESGQGSYTICLDAKSGAERWKTPRPSTSSTASTPCIFRPEGGDPQLILISRAAGMTSLDPRTGKANWELPSLMPRRCVASPIVTPGGLIIAQCGEGQAESLVAAVRPGGQGQPPEKAYEVVRTGGYVPTPVAVGDLLFLWKENGLVTCLRAATNEQLWSERIEGPFYGSPVCVNGRLLNMTRRGELVSLAAAEKFQPAVRVPLGEGSFATPAVAEDAVFLRTFTHLMKLGK